MYTRRPLLHRASSFRATAFDRVLPFIYQVQQINWNFLFPKKQSCKGLSPPCVSFTVREFPYLNLNVLLQMTMKGSSDGTWQARCMITATETF